MEGLWARNKPTDPFVLSLIDDSAALRHEDYASAEGLFKHIDFAST